MNEYRRKFLKKSLWLGASSALFFTHVRGSPTYSKPFVNVELENALKKQAQFIMTFGSPYATQDSAFSPHMHQAFKNNIQSMTQGKVYVDIQDAGQAGIGTELMAKVSWGQLSAALVSMANLSPVAPELDILNIPFWSASNQDYLNLVTSKQWQKLILDKIKKQGFIDVLFHYIPGSRTISSTKAFGKVIKTPEDIKNVNMRIPASKVLESFYQLAGAKPNKVSWKNAAHFAESGRLFALDPSIIGLYNGPNKLRNHISTITQIESVQDGWAAVVSQQWLDTLPREIKISVKEACDKTFKEHLLQVSEISKNCQQKLQELNTKIYVPSADEKQQWIDLCGYQHPHWQSIKRGLLGDNVNFDELLEATQTNNGYFYGIG